MRKIFSLLLSFFLFLLCVSPNATALSQKDVFSQKNATFGEIDVVLSGGGGKGAYEVGVWKAFVDYGIAQKVTVISGTSVGGLNAALFACEKVESVVGFWENFVPEELWNNTYELIDEKGLARIIDKVDLKKMQVNPYPKIYVTATRKRFAVAKLLAKIFLDADYSHRFLLNEESSIPEIKNLLLATSAFPIFTKAIELKDGYKYVDGGVCDNTPIEPLLYDENRENLSVIFVVHLGSDAEYSKRYENVVDIFPSRSLGGLDRMIDFSESTVKDLIELGYSDAVEAFESVCMRSVLDCLFDESRYYPDENRSYPGEPEENF